jgi:hypothetical protein
MHSRCLCFLFLLSLGEELRGEFFFFFSQVVFGVESRVSSDKINEISEDVYKLILYTILDSR